MRSQVLFSVLVLNGLHSSTIAWSTPRQQPLLQRQQQQTQQEGPLQPVTNGPAKLLSRSTAAVATAAMIGWNVLTASPALAVDDPAAPVTPVPTTETVVVAAAATTTTTAASETTTTTTSGPSTVAVAAVQDQPAPPQQVATTATTITTTAAAAEPVISLTNVATTTQKDAPAAVASQVAASAPVSSATTPTGSAVAISPGGEGGPSTVALPAATTATSSTSTDAVSLAAAEGKSSTTTTTAAMEPKQPEMKPTTTTTTTGALEAPPKALATTTTTTTPPTPSYEMILTSAPASRAAVLSTEYADPLHPYCRRRIEVANNGKTFRYIGTSVANPKDDPVLRGCSPEEQQKFKLKSGEFRGNIMVNTQSDTLVVSAGDGIHEGVWEPKNTARTQLGYEDVDGIRWQDGNKWVVQSQASVQRQDGGAYRVIKKRDESALKESVFGVYVAASVTAAAAFYAVLIPEEKQAREFYED